MRRHSQPSKVTAMPDATPAETAPSVQTAPGAAIKLWQSFRRIGLSVAIAYVLICVGMVMMETRLVFPGAYLAATPEFDGPHFSTSDPITNRIVTLDYLAEDEMNLEGRLIVRDDAERVILFLHGNEIRAAEMDHWTLRLSELMNATVLTAEYRGFQGEDFTPTETTCIADAYSALKKLSTITNTPQKQVTIYSRSLGGGIAGGLVELLQKEGTPPDSLILDRTFDSTVSVGADRFVWLPVQLLMRNRFDTASRLADFEGCVVQIHGTPDRIVPMKNGKQLFDSLRTPHKSWIEVPDMYHNDRISDATLKEALAELQRLESEFATTRTVSTTDPEPVDPK
ncbi:alpha/beta hydrolase [Rhodopirellula sallentina]|uniref:alpha/beta hydrolase n=1 Tax=Rhodopirellula sallentina TaxID=1263869 RepID=UPI0006940689|nr:alpha/beta hydrolase [Rhodopirellula sallentina]